MFLDGGKVRSPVDTNLLVQAGEAFGTTPASVRDELTALNHSLLNLVEDEDGPYWTYRHPTVSDAFGSWLSSSQELIEIYLKGAKPETIVKEVVCPGSNVAGAKLVVPISLYNLLYERIVALPVYTLVSFMSYRSNRAFNEQILDARPDLWSRLDHFIVPLREDLDVDLVAALHSQGLLSEDRRLKFVEVVRSAAVEQLDDSFLSNKPISRILTSDERGSILADVERDGLSSVEDCIDRRKNEWSSEYDPDFFFEDLRESVESFLTALHNPEYSKKISSKVDSLIDDAVCSLKDSYIPDDSAADSINPSSPNASDTLESLFRDVAD